MHDDSGYRQSRPPASTIPAWGGPQTHGCLPNHQTATQTVLPVGSRRQPSPAGDSAETNPMRQEANRIDLRLRCDLDGACAARLGDRLVRVLAADTRRIVLWVSGDMPPSPEAACLVNSLGRHMAREGRWRRVELRGEGPGFDALVTAYRQGLALPPASRKE